MPGYAIQIGIKKYQEIRARAPIKRSASYEAWFNNSRNHDTTARGVLSTRDFLRQADASKIFSQARPTRE